MMVLLAFMTRVLCLLRFHLNVVRGSCNMIFVNDEALLNANPGTCCIMRNGISVQRRGFGNRVQVEDETVLAVN